MLLTLIFDDTLAGTWSKYNFLRLPLATNIFSSKIRTNMMGIVILLIYIFLIVSFMFGLIFKLTAHVKLQLYLATSDISALNTGLLKNYVKNKR